MRESGRNFSALGYIIRTWTGVLVVSLSFVGASLATEAPPRNPF